VGALDSSKKRVSKMELAHMSQYWTLSYEAVVASRASPVTTSIEYFPNVRR
jgi:hypothetical protein